MNHSDEEQSGSESASEEEEDSESEEESSDEDEEPVVHVRSYAALMQSLSAEAAPQAKRRKLAHDSESRPERAAGDTEEILNSEEVDVVEEEEEGPETATEGLLEDDDEEDASDPFETHFADPDDNILTKRLKSIQRKEWRSQRVTVPKFGKVQISIPQLEDSKVNQTVISGPHDLKLKQKLATVMVKQRPEFDTVEKHIAPYIFGYQDILFCERTTSSADDLRRLTCLHAVNHVFK